MVKNEPTTPEKRWEWLGRPAPVPVAPTPVAQVKTEPDVREDDDSFDEFPAGAIRYTREELFAIHRARNGLVDDAPPGSTTRDASAPTDFGGLMNQDQSTSEAEAPIQEALEVQAPPAPISTDPTEPTVEQVLQSTINQLMNSKNVQELSIRRTASGLILTVKTPEKEVSIRPTEQVDQMNDSQMSTASSVLVPSRRRLRVFDPSDDEQEEDQEEELPETEPEDDDEEENEEVTPKKKTRAPQVMITPSPAKRLRTLNLNRRRLSSDEEEEEEEEDGDDSSAIDDSQADENPFNDTWRDPEYIPDTQELRDRPSDFRIPKNAVRDPLDLDY